jgi:hypothetical protein
MIAPPPVLPEEPAAVTPHGGFCGGKSQQWLRDPRIRRAAQISAKAISASENWTMTMIELPGVIESGMPGRNGQRKPGTTRGSPRRSRTAKTLRISRPAAKS